MGLKVHLCVEDNSEQRWEAFPDRWAAPCACLSQCDSVASSFGGGEILRTICKDFIMLNMFKACNRSWLIQRFSHASLSHWTQMTLHHQASCYSKGMSVWCRVILLHTWAACVPLPPGQPGVQAGASIPRIHGTLQLPLRI